MNDVILVDVKLTSDPIDVLLQNRIISYETHSFLKLAFKHGGYVAGGCALKYASRTLRSNGTIDHDKIIDFDYNETDAESFGKYLGYGTVQCLKKVEFGKFSPNDRYGDIDVLFPDFSSMKAFKSDKSLLNIIGDIEQLFKEH